MSTATAGLVPTATIANTQPLWGRDVGEEGCLAGVGRGYFPSFHWVCCEYVTHPSVVTNMAAFHEPVPLHLILSHLSLKR